MKAQPLGEGGFGVVTKAKNIVTGNTVAIKSMQKDSIDDIGAFKKEVNVQIDLDHQHIVKLYEIFEDDFKFYLVMELCTGGELFDRISDAVDKAGHGAFDETHAATYMQQILSAISYLHFQEVAHRDIKPENFLMEDSSEDAKIKVIDFGLSKRFTPGEKMLTAAGTPFYAAPEVVLGDGYDERCDVWSCGIILYILLCGYPPFSGDTDAAVLQEVVRGRFEFESPHWDDVSNAPRKLIKRMLTLDARKRPTAHVCLEDRWLHDHAEKPKKTVHIDLGNKLRTFRGASKFKKVALTLIASQMPQTDIDDLRDAFTTLDLDQDGLLSVQEIQEGMAKSDLQLPDDIMELLSVMDSDGSGRIDYTEFVAATIDRQQYLKKEVLWAAFSRLDKSHDSIIHKSDVQGLLKESDDSALVDEILNDIDVHGDGQISFQDFCDLMGR